MDRSPPSCSRHSLWGIVLTKSYAFFGAFRILVFQVNGPHREDQKWSPEGWLQTEFPHAQLVLGDPGFYLQTSVAF